MLLAPLQPYKFFFRSFIRRFWRSSSSNIRHRKKGKAERKKGTMEKADDEQAAKRSTPTLKIKDEQSSKREKADDEQAAKRSTHTLKIEDEQSSKRPKLKQIAASNRVSLKSEEMEGSPNFIIKFESFPYLETLLIGDGLKKHVSGKFSVGGYKWRFIVSFVRDLENKVQIRSKYISLEVQKSECEDDDAGLEILAKLNFFVLDQLREEYIVITDGLIHKFTNEEREQGMHQAFSRLDLQDSSKGFLVDNVAVFGVGISIVSADVKSSPLLRAHTGSLSRGERWFQLESPIGSYFKWTLQSFKSLTQPFYDSLRFRCADMNWGLRVYPRYIPYFMGIYIYLFTETDAQVIMDYTVVVDAYNINYSMSTADAFAPYNGRRSRPLHMSLDMFRDDSGLSIELYISKVSVVEKLE